MQRWILAVACVACSGGAAPRPAPIANTEPPSDASIPIDAEDCPKRCIDICCQENEVCQHGGADDGTIPYCRKVGR